MVKKKSDTKLRWWIVLLVVVLLIVVMVVMHRSSCASGPVVVVDAGAVEKVIEKYQDPAVSPLVSAQDASLSSWDVVEYRSSMVRMATFVIVEPVQEEDPSLALLSGDAETLVDNRASPSTSFPLWKSPPSTMTTTTTTTTTTTKWVDVVPRIVHICWKNTWVSSRVYDEILFQNLARSQGFDHRFYTNATIMKFLRVHFPPVVLETYLMINPEYGACMSDFFRYCVLYVYGGVYLDIKSQILAPLSELWKKQLVQPRPRDVLCVSYWPGSIQDKIQAVELEHKHGEIMNWVLVCSKGHPFMKVIIDKMVANIQQWHKYKYLYGEKINVLRLTGPIFLTRVILQELKDPQQPTRSIFIDEVLNEYFRYSSVSTPKQISYDMNVYQDAGVTHYSQFTDPIVLFGGEGPPILSYFTTSSTEKGTPLQLSLSSSSSSSSSISYVLKPVLLSDPTEVDAILKSVFQSLELDADEAARSTIRFQSWGKTSQQDFIRYAVLYDRGGYFVDSSMSLSSDPAWDLYVKQVDCVISIYASQDFDVQPATMLSPLLMKFPAHHELLKKSMIHMLTPSSPRTGTSETAHNFAVLTGVLQRQHNPISRLLSIKHDDQNQSLLVSTARFSHKAWLELPETTQDVVATNKSVVLHFAGFPIGFVKI